MTYRKLWEYQPGQVDLLLTTGKQKEKKQEYRKTTEVLHQTRTSKNRKKWEV